MVRYLFEIAEEQSRLSLYDADRQALLAEFGGAEAREFLASVEGLYQMEKVEGCSRSHSGGCRGHGCSAANDPPSAGNELLRQSLNQALGKQGMGHLSHQMQGVNFQTPGRAVFGSFPLLDGLSGALSGSANLPGSGRLAPLQPLTEAESGAQENPEAKICRAKIGESATQVKKARLRQPSSKGRKLWDIDHKYHCPLIGTCLTADELRQLGERHAHRPKERLSDFEVHISFVAAARERNGLSIATHKRLDKKYASELRLLAKRRDSAQLQADWQDALATGQVPGILWALLSHPLTDEALSERIYEDLHMLSHQIGMGQRAEVRRLHESKAELIRLRHDFDALNKRSRAQLDAAAREQQELTRALREKTVANQRLHGRVEALTRQCETADAAGGSRRLAGLERKLANLNARLVRIQDERDHWRLACAEAEGQCEQARQTCGALQTSMLALEQRLAELLNESADTPSSDLGGRQVLCVGGRLATVEQYRALTRGCNGSFAHHDGGMEDNQNRLEAMLATADLVVCVTEFVSHDAYRRTKQFCKRHTKPHALLANAGLGSFSQALAELAEQAEQVALAAA
ncbi:hypothetical protein Thiowin_02405 [Thiorhodovibrio winogradskyi]|uniref:DUF2325 domain-containing protein n=1 Tax=Thiorhodovibrio winogradskyi TaxID=77007 RepID=A0ABZ0SAQ2_9GAMM|nr:DUF2325 domain-containing protein [Thiorhodovibrio winogradskyi]